MLITDDVLFLGCPMLEMLGLNIYTRLTACARRKVERRTKPMDSANYIACRRMGVLEAIQQQPMDDGQVAADQAVGSVVECGLETIMEPVIEETGRRMVWNRP